MKSLVSIVVPVYNAAKYIEATVMSVVNQSYEKWELLLVDDGSTDGSVEIIKKLSVLFDVSVYFLMFGKEDPHSYSYTFNDGNVTSIKVSDLKDDEKLLIMNYRLLNSQNKEKVYREAKELSEKQN